MASLVTTMSKKQADAFLHWLYQWMRNRTTFIRFKFMEPGICAEYVAYNIDDTVDIYDIPLDPTAPLLPAIIHEGLHVKYPQKKDEEDDDYEKRIEKLTWIVVEHLTEKQFLNLFRRLAEELISVV